MTAVAQAAAKIAPLSHFARFVAADVKGGEYAIAHRVNEITTALNQAFKGNHSPVTETIALALGSSVKAKAYAAGFTAIGGSPAKIGYIGKLDSAANKQVRDKIDSATAHAVATFFTAFDLVITTAKAEADKKREAKKAAKPKAEAESTPAAAAESAPAIESAVSAIDAQVAAIETAIYMLKSGLCTQEQVAAIKAAMPTKRHKVAPEVFASALLVAQADQAMQAAH